MVLKLGTLILSSIFLTTCVTEQKIDYSPTFVPEEGNIHLVEITDDQDKVSGPLINFNTPNPAWYPNDLISVSPDNQFIAFLAYTNKSRNIFIKKVEGGLSTIQRTFRTEIIDVAFSPDSKNIAFSDFGDGSDNVYMINTSQGSSVQQITSTPSNETGPAFSPDSKLIYFSKSEIVSSHVNAQGLTENTYRYYIWSYNRDNATLTQYTDGTTPCVLQDGKRLLVTRANKETNKGEIWMFDAVSGQETMIYRDKDKGFSSAQISPDGKTIVFVGSTLKSNTKPANLDIFTINLDGTGLTQLTFHPGHDVSPVWSPDGKSIYFLSQRGNNEGKWNVWKMNYNKL